MRFSARVNLILATAMVVMVAVVGLTQCPTTEAFQTTPSPSAVNRNRRHRQ